MNGKIWVLGDAVVDLLPDGEGRLLQCPGGAPANVAVGVARLGGDSGFYRPRRRRSLRPFYASHRRRSKWM